LTVFKDGLHQGSAPLSHWDTSHVNPKSGKGGYAEHALCLSAARASAGGLTATCVLPQEVEHLMSLPAQLHRMVQNGIPWWQIMYTGIMSTDAVLMIEVSQRSSTRSSFCGSMVPETHWLTL
jgi:hypothetical protein